MSGVAKDDTNPSSPPDETVSVTDESKAPGEDAAAAAAAHEEAESRIRRPAPHLRVVSDNAGEFAPAPPAPPAEPPQRIGDAIRAARENAGFTLEQVSRETRVHLSHLRAIEEMTPRLLGAPVYAKGYIRTYARFLGMDDQATLDRYLTECGAILKDPEKPEIAPPATSKARKLPVAVPMLGIVLAVLAVGGGVYFLSSGEKAPAAAPETPAIAPGAGPIVEPVAPQLRIVALKRAMLEVRSAKGDKYVHRYYNPGESFIVRVGAGFTVTAEDGTAFEWKLGDQSLGLLQPEGGPVFSQNVDLAAQRQPVAPPPAPATDVPASAVTGVSPDGNPVAVAPAPPKPRPQPRPAATQPPAATAAPAPAAPAATPPPARDPALDAYPDQIPAASAN